MDDLNENEETANSADTRSEEEISWDAEFADMEEPRASGVTGTLGDLAKMIAQVPAALVQLPMALLPEDTQKHARTALLEGFLAVRSLLDAVGDGIEGALGGQPSTKTATSGGPEGTWGTRRYGSASTPPGKAQRIEIQDEVSESGGGDGSGMHITIDDLGDSSDNDSEDSGEGRGMRAGVDY